MISLRDARALVLVAAAAMAIPSAQREFALHPGLCHEAANLLPKGLIGNRVDVMNEVDVDQLASSQVIIPVIGKIVAQARVVDTVVGHPWASRQMSSRVPGSQ